MADTTEAGEFSPFKLPSSHKSWTHSSLSARLSTARRFCSQSPSLGKHPSATLSVRRNGHILQCFLFSYMNNSRSRRRPPVNFRGHISMFNIRRRSPRYRTGSHSTSHSVPYSELLKSLPAIQSGSNSYRRCSSPIPRTSSCR